MRLYNSKDYQQYLKPILQQAFNNKWLDPNQLDQSGQPLFKSYEAFHKAYTEEYGRARAYQEIFNMIENAEAVVTNLAKQLKNPDKNYELG